MTEQEVKPEPSQSLQSFETLKRKESLSDDDEVEIVQIVGPSGYQDDESKRITRQLSAKDSIINDEMKFMADFDPANSMRKQKKNRRRYYHPDGRPMIQAQDYDDCDCLNPKCPGCHYPCKSCGDTRCGHECRINRRWVYESVEIEGWNRILKNRHLDNFNTYDYE